ncbi:carbon-nitrogen hydrolase family protein [Asticcacaulis biprosthecium C19]|uniref:Carbon-nitrogen hydrolase family protein n=1 Tax=Asticcacaulis biprosthecium C19 TaxID=715226 RepID=F4QH17_9CAUL|nr:carbon-nitrogen hydrolase family protein [Asticcacaulis biprosthecium]EGF92554.1 carbon-nitrogen hydrolase family protein [Asticcacaulis biprosthecium C19]
MTLDVALVQLTTPADARGALDHAAPLIREAAAMGAQLILLPECANLVEQRREFKTGKVATEDDDVFVIGVRALAKARKVSILIGSVIVASGRDHRAANRTLLIGPDGDIQARYDKIHLFDADTPDGKSYRESATMCPGDQAVVANTPSGRLGLSICYDVRFAHLYRTLAKAGVDMIAVPAAFTVPTGRAHWEVMLRARAIETGAFVLAPAQGGAHEDGRQTWGHSLVVNPWGEVIARLDHDRPAILTATLDLAEVTRARQALPQLQHDRVIGHP